MNLSYQAKSYMISQGLPDEEQSPQASFLHHPREAICKYGDHVKQILT